MGAKLAAWPVAPARNFQRDDLFFMPGTDSQERQHTESARMLGILQGSVEGLRASMQDFRVDVASRHKENQDAIARLVHELKTEADRATAASIERIEKLETCVDELQSQHDENQGKIKVLMVSLKIAPLVIAGIDLLIKFFPKG